MSAPLTLERADSRRNRALVLAAARRAFAEKGTSVTLVEIARSAGVGAGTVYRHFPTKSALLQAVMQERIDRMTELIAAGLEASDPGATFFAVCTELVVSAPRVQALCDLVQSDDGWPNALIGARFHQALGALLRAAQLQGSVRADITVADITEIFTGCVAIQRHRRYDGRLSRGAGLVLDSLRAPTAVTKVGAQAKRHNEIGARNEMEQTRHCPICGTAMRPAGTGRPPRYCSSACRQKAHRRRAADRGRAAG
ncbi:TetR/AcrR family transcriptional regulator [Nocardia arthritidis]|uniref:TetR family transcriptional regulator n=1 Tax=Nocardia arthritidis TaxID=228602 RepID=A0A6G9YNG2_9NOCA|nr:TetR/AcrR family transcriptional regulator [Nocardia arthritidis]QIS14617.1 TetR family transcriptional regulator [Nocardia arthritidis]